MNNYDDLDYKHYNDVRTNFDWFSDFADDDEFCRLNRHNYIVYTSVGSPKRFTFTPLNCKFYHELAKDTCYTAIYDYDFRPMRYRRIELFLMKLFYCSVSFNKDFSYEWKLEPFTQPFYQTITLRNNYAEYYIMNCYDENTHELLLCYPILMKIDENKPKCFSEVIICDVIKYIDSAFNSLDVDRFIKQYPLECFGLDVIPEENPIVSISNGKTEKCLVNVDKPLPIVADKDIPQVPSNIDNKKVKVIKLSNTRPPIHNNTKSESVPKNPACNKCTRIAKKNCNFCTGRFKRLMREVNQEVREQLKQHDCLNCKCSIRFNNYKTCECPCHPRMLCNMPKCGKFKGVAVNEECRFCTDLADEDCRYCNKGIPDDCEGYIVYRKRSCIKCGVRKKKPESKKKTPPKAPKRETIAPKQKEATNNQTQEATTNDNQPATQTQKSKKKKQRRPRYQRKR